MQQIINKILAYIRQNGGVLSEWYVGITDDPEKRLFTEHSVQKKDGAWIYRDAGTSIVARVIEQNLFEKGCDGGPGGGDDNTCYVYAYKISPNTRE